MRFLKKISALIVIISMGSVAAEAQVCIPTYGTVCFTGGGAITYDIIDNFWTEGAEINIVNMDTDCCLLPDNYWYTGMGVTVCPGQTVTTNVQCQEDSFIQGFAIWIDWNQDDIFSAAEKVYESPDASDEVYTGTFDVPGDAPSGEVYNMRVRSEYAVGGAFIDPCDLQTYGETEDYLVIIGNCAPTICEGDTVTLDLDPLPAGVISYDWTPTTYISDPTAGPTVDVWPPDTTTYTCTITSADSTWDVVMDVFVVHPANPTAGLDDSVCFDPGVGIPLDGNVEVPEDGLNIEWENTAFIGVGTPFTIFSPDDDIVDPTLQVSVPGIYEVTLTVSDLSGYCPEQTDVISLTFSEAMHEVLLIDPTCLGDSDGSIIIASTGTLPAAEYSIDGGLTWQPTPTFTDLPAGMYTVMTRDVLGCEYSSEEELVDPEPITLSVSSDTTICQNGTATLTATAGGGDTYIYDWSIPGADPTATQDLSPTVTTTIVTVTAYSELGCASPEESIEVTLRDPISLIITENDSVCPGYDTDAFVTASGGDGAYTYVWTVNGEDHPSTINSISGTPEVNTTYCVTVDDGCETTPVTVCTQTIMRPVPEPTFTSDVTAACNPATVTFEADVIPGDVAVWKMDGRTYTDLDIVMHEFTEVGFYDVWLEITNQYGCFNSITAVEYFESVEIPHPEFYINPNPTTMFNPKVVLTPAVEGDDNTFEWDIPEGTPSTSTDESPVVYYPDGVPGDYPVVLTVTNGFGCVNSIKHDVNVVSDVIIYSPNIFTPDGDEFNEGWRVYIEGIDIYDYHCQVYNRWGEIVWESFNDGGVWNGTYGSDIAPAGTYVWVITTKEKTTDKKLEFRGFVTIVR